MIIIIIIIIIIRIFSIFILLLSYALMISTILGKIMCR